MTKTGLYLVFGDDPANPTFERECEGIGTTTDEQQYEADGSHLNLMCVGGKMWRRKYQVGKPTNTPVEETEYTCLHCNGTGEVPVRLRGGVEVTARNNHHGHEPWFLLGGEPHHPAQNLSILSDLKAWILDAHKRGTLHASMYRSDENRTGLYEEVV